MWRQFTYSHVPKYSRTMKSSFTVLIRRWTQLSPSSKDNDVCEDERGLRSFHTAYNTVLSCTHKWTFALLCVIGEQKLPLFLGKRILLPVSVRQRGLPANLIEPLIRNRHAYEMRCQLKHALRLESACFTIAVTCFLDHKRFVCPRPT